MKRGIKTRIFIGLRKLGMLCKKTEPYKPKLKIQKSLTYEGEVTNHKDFMFAKNALQGVNKINKDKKLCHYNFQTHTCRCGITVEKLKNQEQCPIKQSNL
jgi:rubrerythrin